MEKIRIYSVIAVLALSGMLTSCYEKREPESVPGTLVFKACSQEVHCGEKASMSRDGSIYSVDWEQGDLLAITDGNSSARFSAESSGPYSSFVKYDGDDLSETPGTVYTAYYPSSYYQDGQYVLPSEQTYQKRGVRIFPMVARNEGTELNFRSVCSILEVRISTDTDNAGKIVEKVVLESSGEPLCGEVDCDFGTDAVSVDGGNRLSLICGDGVEIGTTPTPFMFAVPPGSYSGGLRMTVYTSDGCCQSMETQSSVLLKRSFLHATGAVYDEIVWDYSYGSANSVDAFGLSQVKIDVTPYSVGADCMRIGVAKKAPEATSAAIIWNNDGGIISGTPALDGNVLTVNLVPAAYGNALVSIKDSEGVVLWSYHIWKPKSDPDATIRYPEQGIDVMPMPLGAVAPYSGGYSADVTGLYYQWGRKDPLPRTGSIPRILEQDVYSMIESETIRQSAVMVDYATRNPGTFICNAQATAYDWASTVVTWRNDNLWGDPFGYESPSRKKSVYDPCPEGYRVAQRNTASTFSFDEGNIIYDADGTTFRGHRFEISSGVWDCYMAQGYRSRSNGGVTGAGQGFYWMSCPNVAVNSAAAGFNFTSALVTPASSRVRAYGFPLRCCK